MKRKGKEIEYWSGIKEKPASTVMPNETKPAEENSTPKPFSKNKTGKEKSKQPGK